MTELCVDDFAGSERSLLPPDVWDYLDGGSGSESVLAANRHALDRLSFLPSFLVDVTGCNSATTLLGKPMAAPIGVAPMAYHRLFHPDGEVGAASAAGDCGMLFTASIFASQPLEEIAKATTGPLWLQLYWLKQRTALVDLIQRAEAAGFDALVLTIDAPRVGRRLRDLRNGFAIPPHIRAVNLDADVMATSHRSEAGVSAIEQHSREQFDASITWADLSWLRARTSLPIVLKGILTPGDAERAIDSGAAGIVVSNHGGRQLQCAVASATALPAIVDVVAGRCPVLVDGGIRSGADVLKVLALGAEAVLVGRPVLWGLAANGRAGATAVLQMLRDELEETMALCGRPELAAVDRSLIADSGIIASP